MIWAKQSRALLSKWMPLKTMPLLVKSLSLQCLPLLLTVSQKVGLLPGVYFEPIQSTKLKPFKIKRSVVVLGHGPQLGCPSHGVTGAACTTLQRSPGGSPLPKASKPRTGDDLCPVWGPGSFGSSEHFTYLWLSLLPAFWGRCCSSQIPCWGDSCQKQLGFFLFPVLFPRRRQPVMLSKDDITLPRGGYAPSPVRTLSHHISLEHRLAPCSTV